MRCLFFVFIVISSCTSNKSHLPSIYSVSGLEIPEERIVYQFYEKFGFTDLCEHNRLLLDSISIVIDSSWVELPIQESDLDKINHISNKVDTLLMSGYSVRYRYKSFFSDISIEIVEYLRKNSNEKDFILNLQNGYYKLSKENLVIYDDKKSMIFYENHTCYDE